MLYKLPNGVYFDPSLVVGIRPYSYENKFGIAISYSNGVHYECSAAESLEQAKGWADEIAGITNSLPIMEPSTGECGAKATSHEDDPEYITMRRMIQDFGKYDASPVRALAEILNEHENLVDTLLHIIARIKNGAHKESVLYAIQSALETVKRTQEKN